MALWGNNDNVDSVGTVSLDYSTLIVTGSGTSFGNAGSAKTGDVIRFGFRDASSGVSTYFGDAVIVGIASTTQLTIGSTAGLSGGGIGGTSLPSVSLLYSLLGIVITAKTLVLVERLTSLCMVFLLLDLKYQTQLLMRQVLVGLESPHTMMLVET